MNCPLCHAKPDVDVDPCMGRVYVVTCSDCFDGEPDATYTIEGFGPTPDEAIEAWHERATEVAESLADKQREDEYARADHAYDVARDARMFEEDYR